MVNIVDFESEALSLELTFSNMRKYLTKLMKKVNYSSS